jgi:hypothetical protein
MDVSAVVDDVLTHHGVKGMRWGLRRKATVGPQEVVVSDRRNKVKTSGGAGHPSSKDAVRARTLGQVGKKSGLKALSNKELQDYAQRLQLEQNVKRLSQNDRSAGKKFAMKLLGQTAQTTAQSTANELSSQQVKAQLSKLKK